MNIISIIAKFFIFFSIFFVTSCSSYRYENINETVRKKISKENSLETEFQIKVFIEDIRKEAWVNAELINNKYQISNKGQKELLQIQYATADTVFRSSGDGGDGGDGDGGDGDGDGDGDGGDGGGDGDD